MYVKKSQTYKVNSFTIIGKVVRVIRENWQALVSEKTQARRGIFLRFIFKYRFYFQVFVGESVKMDWCLVYSSVTLKLKPTELYEF